MQDGFGLVVLHIYFGMFGTSYRVVKSTENHLLNIALFFVLPTDIADNDYQMKCCIMAATCQPTTSERSLVKDGRADAGQEPSAEAGERCCGDHEMFKRQSQIKLCWTILNLANPVESTLDDQVQLRSSPRQQSPS
jgi:hypothetical protein